MVPTLRAALLSLALLTSARVGSLEVTRSSLTGFDITGAGHGLSLDEAAEALSAFEGRVRAALHRAATSLKLNYGLAGSCKVAFGRSRSLGRQVARISLTLAGPVGARERSDALGLLLICLRDHGLEAERRGDDEAVALGDVS